MSTRRLSHRMVFESVNQQIIPDGYQIHYINCDKQDNSIVNLELVTRKQNMKYEGQRRKGMKYKTKIEITSDKPIESIKLEIKMKESDDEFTEDEKQLIDKKYNAMMKKIENGNFPYKKQLQQNFFKYGILVIFNFAEYLIR